MSTGSRKYVDRQQGAMSPGATSVDRYIVLFLALCGFPFGSQARINKYITRNTRCVVSRYRLMTFRFARKATLCLVLHNLVGLIIDYGRYGQAMLISHSVG